MKRLLLIALLLMTGAAQATDYYVQPGIGADGNLGTSIGAGNSWATTQKAATTATGGDVVYLCASASDQPTAIVDWNTNAGSIGSPIQFIGADSGGTPLTTGFFTLDGVNLPATTDLAHFTMSNSYIIFEHVRFTGGTRDGVFIDNSVYIRFRNCRMDNHDSDGIYSTSTTGHVWLTNCEIDNNTANGTQINGSGRFNATVSGGSVHDNGSSGLRVGGDAGETRLSNVKVYGNAADGVVCDGHSYFVTDCTISDNTGDGFQGGADRGTVVNTTSSRSGGYGFNFATDDFCLLLNSHTYSNTIGPINGSPSQENNQTGDPLFSDYTTADFVPGSGSPLNDNGIGSSTIGVLPQAGVSGGTVIIVVED